jgi:hypothetical protein
MGYISDRLEARRDYMNYRFNGEKDNMDGE